jgi:MFS family permease
VVLHLAVLAMPFYVTLTGQVREFVPPHRLGRAITSLYLFGLSAAFLAQWLTGLLVGLSAEPGRIGSPLGYRLVFAFLAAMLLGTLLIYRQAPERRVATDAAAPPAPHSSEPRSAAGS